MNLKLSPGAKLYCFYTGPIILDVWYHDITMLVQQVLIGEFVFAQFSSYCVLQVKLAARIAQMLFYSYEFCY